MINKLALTIGMNEPSVVKIIEPRNGFVEMYLILIAHPANGMAIVLGKDWCEG